MRSKPRLSSKILALLTTLHLSFSQRLSSIHRAQQPVFVLLLDAKSAFDKVATERAVRNDYLAGTTDQGLIYLDSRLRNRKTYIEGNKVLMGPIDDTIAVEQGGVKSDQRDYWK